MSLSPTEQRILAALEDELVTDEPWVVAALTPPAPPSLSLIHRFPLPARHMALLGIALLLLVVVAPIVNGYGPAALAALTAAVMVPWAVSAARAAEQRQRRRLEAPQSAPADQDVS
jgi:Protein of unknown function (DUF3040)